MDYSQIVWEPGSPAPMAARTDPQVFWARFGVPLHARLLDRPIGVVLHWISTPHLKPKGRSLPCLGRVCQHCKEGSKRELKAYGPALKWVRDPLAHEKKGGKGGTWEPGVVEVPGDAWEELQAQVMALTPSGAEPRWRGTVLQLVRSNDRSNSRVFVKVLETQLTDPIPESFDVRPVLMRIWGMRDRLIMPQPADADGPPIIPFRQKGGA